MNKKIVDKKNGKEDVKKSKLVERKYVANGICMFNLLFIHHLCVIYCIKIPVKVTQQGNRSLKYYGEHGTVVYRTTTTFTIVRSIITMSVLL